MIFFGQIFSEFSPWNFKPSFKSSKFCDTCMARANKNGGKGGCKDFCVCSRKRVQHVKKQENGDDTARETSPGGGFEGTRHNKQRDLCRNWSLCQSHPIYQQKCQTHPLIQRQASKWSPTKADRQKQTHDCKDGQKERNFHRHSNFQGPEVLAPNYCES